MGNFEDNFEQFLLMGFRGERGRGSGWRARSRGGVGGFAFEGNRGGRRGNRGGQFRVRVRRGESLVAMAG